MALASEQVGIGIRRHFTRAAATLDGVTLRGQVCGALGDSAVNIAMPPGDSALRCRSDHAVCSDLAARRSAVVRGRSGRPRGDDRRLSAILRVPASPQRRGGSTASRSRSSRAKSSALSNPL